MAAFSVLLDATAVPADRGGVGRYVDGLVGALARTEAEFSLVCQRLDAERYRQLAPNANVVAGPGAIAHRSARLAWEQTGLPLVAEQAKADLIHCPAYTMPIAAGRPVVVTVHDATMFSQPEFLPSVRGTFLRSATRASLRRSARCIVPSKATRNELVRLLDADATRLDVAYHGVDVETFHPPSEQETRKVANRLGLHGRPYVAFLGALEPRHNVPGLVRAWMEAARDREILPHWSSPAGRVGTMPSTKRSPRCRCTCAWYVRDTCAIRTCAASSVAPSSSRTRASERASGCPSLKQWPVVPPS